jgi:hypothetical protein
LLKLPCAEHLIQPPHRAFGCFSLLILNDRAAPSYQLLDLSFARLPLDSLLSFEVDVLVLSFLDNCLPRINASPFSRAALIYFPSMFRSASLILSCQHAVSVTERIAPDSRLLRCGNSISTMFLVGHSRPSHPAALAG